MELKREPLFEGFEYPSQEDFAALGHFVSNCSSLEITLHATLRHILGINEEISRLLIGEPRVGELSELFRRAAEIKKIKDDRLKALNNTRDWIAYIYRIRSVVAHKPFTIKSNKLHFHNRVTAKRTQHAWEYDCTLDELKRCANFIDRVTAEVYRVALENLKEFGKLPRYDSSKKILQELTLPPDPARIQNPNAQ